MIIIIENAPTIVVLMLFLVGVEKLRGGDEWKPLVVGAGCFGVAWALHLAFAEELKIYAGVKDQGGDAFSSFTTLIGLVFSLQLGQTYSYATPIPTPTHAHM